MTADLSCSERRLCAWCRGPIVSARADALFCRKACRQATFRLRRRRATEDAERGELVFVFCDPPYPGLARKYYGNEPTYAGEVDHAELIASLEYSRGGRDLAGWALSTSAKALRDVLPLCPPEARVCSWTKPIGACPATFGIHNAWEPLIVVPGRSLRPGKRDHLSAQPARGGGELPGRKPIAFCAWLFDLLGMLPGDTLLDVYPGTGVVGRAWAEISSRAARGDASREYFDDASLGAVADAGG